MKRQITNSVLFITLVLSSSLSLAKEALLPVNVSPLSELLISAKNSAPANIISLNHSIISAEITGRALHIHVEAGDMVKKYKSLASLDCRSYSLAKKQAEAALKVTQTQLNYASKQFVRNKNLLKRGTISRQIFEKAEAGKLTAIADINLKKAAIETAKLAISRCQIYAPFSGQITKRLVQKGQLVRAGTPLFQLMQTHKLEIKTNLSPANIARLKDSPLLEFMAGNQSFKTTIRSIIQDIDETTRTQEVRLTLPSDIQVAAGLSGRIQWRNKEKQIPAEYIVRRGNHLGVMIANDIVEGIGKAHFYPLPEASEGQAAIITLPKTSLLITKNRYRVKDGEPIKIQP